MDKRISLSIEEMKRLEELGLDTSDASMAYYERLNTEFGEVKDVYTLNLKPQFEFGYFKMIPAYTLQDIIDKLPEDIYVGNTEAGDRIYLELGMNKGNWSGKYQICYSVCYDFDNTEHNCEYYHEEINENYLDAAYNMLIWVIENNYIKTK